MVALQGSRSPTHFLSQKPVVSPPTPTPWAGTGRVGTLTSSFPKPRPGGTHFVAFPAATPSLSHRHHFPPQCFPHKLCNPQITCLSSAGSFDYLQIEKRSKSVTPGFRGIYPPPIHGDLSLKRQKGNVNIKLKSCQNTLKRTVTFCLTSSLASGSNDTIMSSLNFSGFES